MLRRLIRRYRWLLLLFASVYIGVCIWLMTSLQVLESKPRFLYLFERVFDPFGSIIKRDCRLDEIHDGYDARYKSAGPSYRTDIVIQTDKCYLSDLKEWKATIEMETVWDSVSVSYPSLVLTVTGWVEPIQIEAWSSKQLHVVIVPHSHQDPGWLVSIDSYFTTKTKSTLNLIVERLTQDPHLKFVWTEIVFLEKWWNQAPLATQERFKRLLTNGQLELLTGGWVMTDESVAHYGAMLDQLTEGHLWVKDMLNKTIETGWAIDPFGHSSTMSYLLGQSGVQNNVIQRAHYAIKRHLAATQSLEFYWKQHWDHHGNKRILTHIMPFLLYGIANSCGPDRSVCCKFDFYKKQCFYGNKHVETIKVDDNNVKQLFLQMDFKSSAADTSKPLTMRAYEFWEQLQKKSQLFRHNVLLVPHGDDFRYNEHEEWDKQFKNMAKIMSYINNRADMNMKIEYGTVGDYFTAVKSQTKPPTDHDYPTLSGDLYPYSDRGEQFWSGFYSVRPFYKYIVRKLQAILRSAEVLLTFSLSKLMINTDMTALYTHLQAARRGLALFQHHDAITGTSRKVVMDDYGVRLHKAMKQAQYVYQWAAQRILQNKLRQGGKDLNISNTIHLNLAEAYRSKMSLPTLSLLKIGVNHSTVMVSNTLGFGRQEIIHVLVNRSSVVVMASGEVLQHQISPVWLDPYTIDNSQFLLSFAVNIAPFSINTYTIKQSNMDKDKPHVAKIVNFTSGADDRFQLYSYPFMIVSDTSSTMTYSNSFLTAHFTTCDGTLKSIHYHNEDVPHKCDVHFVSYTTGERVHPFKDKSGAYTFVPDGPAKVLETARPVVTVVQGALFTQIRTVYMDIIHTATIYNISGPLGQAVHLENTVNINRDVWDNRELVMRVSTDVRDNQHTFCTDVNGFQLHRRKTRAKLSIQGNFYPMTTMAVVENQDTKFTLLTDSSHGVASLVSGWLEMVLDRRLMQDDWRGLNEDVSDNLPTKSSFLLMFERKTSTNSYEAPKHKHLCFPSMVIDHLSGSLNNPLVILQSSSPLPGGPGSSPPQIKLARPFPCDLHLVNFRLLPLKEKSRAKHALMVLHRRGLDCNVQTMLERCSTKESLSLAELSSLTVTEIEETLLTGTRSNKQLPRTASITLPVMTMKSFIVSYT